MSCHRPLALALALGMAGTLPASAVILIVNNLDGVNEVPGEFPTIQAALNASANGEVVRVAPGIYLENLDFGSKSVTLESAEGPEDTIIDAGGGQVAVFHPIPPSTGFYIVGTYTQTCAIHGFTIRNASADGSAAIPVDSFTKLTITGNLIEDNASGPVVRVVNQGGAIIDGNVFRNNGSGVVPDSPVIQADTLNTLLIRNNLFSDNPCAAVAVNQPNQGNLAFNTGPLQEFSNNTLVRNATGIRIDNLNLISPFVLVIGETPVPYSQLSFSNNLLHRNGTGLASYRELGDLPRWTGDLMWNHNLVHGNGTDYSGTTDLTGMAGNLSADPLLADEAGNDFRLTRLSPAVDAGVTVTALAVDFEGELRPSDGDGDEIAVPDIGMDEYHGGLRIVVEGGSQHESASPAGTEVTVDVVPVAPASEPTSVQLYLNGQPVADTFPATVTLALGENVLEAIGSSAEGPAIDAVRRVTIVDTTPPVIDARFVDRRTGSVVETIGSKRLQQIDIRIDLTDNGDPDPTYQSVLGTPVRDGQRLSYSGARRSVTLNTESMTLQVTATDGSGNTSTLSRTLDITIQQPTFRDYFARGRLAGFAP